MKLMNRISYFLPAVFSVFVPSAAYAHLVNANVGEFYAGMLHPVTSVEHILPMIALALLASQGSKQAGRQAVLFFPLALIIGILAGSRLPSAGFLLFANLAMLAVLGVFLVAAHRLPTGVVAAGAAVTGLILGWRSGGDWAASSIGFRFVPGVALTGFIVLVLFTAWVPRASDRIGRLLRSMAGCGFLIAGLAMLGELFMGAGPTGGRGIGLPTEESLKALVAAPELSLSFIIGAFFVAMVWGGAHALTPGHGKAIVGAYLVGARGTAWHAIYLGLTVTITHTLGVFILGLAATLAANHVDPETLYPWLGIFSGLIVLVLGASMFINRLRFVKKNDTAHTHDHGHPHGHDHNHDHSHIHDHDHSHIHDHDHSHIHDQDQSHIHDHEHGLLHAEDGHHHTAGAHDHPQGEAHTAGAHRHDPSYHYHGGKGHSHLPPGADGAPLTWRSLLTLGISGGLLPCPSALVLLLTAVALHRIWFGLALVTAFSIGLAVILTIVGLLFIKGSHLINRTPTFALASRWLPMASALVVCLLGCGITWGAVLAVLKMTGG